MAGMTDERAARVKSIVCYVLEIDEEELTDDCPLREHGADSLRSIEILSLLETEFGIVIDQANLSRLGTLDSVRRVLAETPGW
jgi:acyl carrier protein